MYGSDVEGRRVRGRPCFRWLDGDTNTCVASLVELNDATVKCLKREHFRALMSELNYGINI